MTVLTQRIKPTRRGEWRVGKPNDSAVLRPTTIPLTRQSKAIP
jgi:hypothetical protein